MEEYGTTRTRKQLIRFPIARPIEFLSHSGGFKVRAIENFHIYSYNIFDFLLQAGDRQARTVKQLRISLCVIDPKETPYTLTDSQFVQ